MWIGLFNRQFDLPTEARTQACTRKTISAARQRGQFQLENHGPGRKALRVLSKRASGVGRTKSE